MKRYLYLILIALISPSCKKEVIQDGELLPIARAVQLELSNRGVYFNIDMNLIIEEGLEDREKAWGISYNGKSNAIHISKRMYDNCIKDNRSYVLEYLMAHEIGHHKLGLNHSLAKTDSQGNPIVMSKGMFQSIPKEDKSKMYDAIANSIQ